MDWLAWLIRKIQYVLLRESIRKHGFISPVIATVDGVVLDGSRRVQACKELGIRVPAIVINAYVAEFDPSEFTGLCPVDMPRAVAQAGKE